MPLQLAEFRTSIKSKRHKKKCVLQITGIPFLLNKGADTDLKNQDGNTAEELARLAGQAKIQTLLKQKRKA